MKLWPSEQFEIETRLSPEEIAAALRTQVEPKKLFRFGRSHLRYQGDIGPHGFEIMRIIHYRNSFLPVVAGRFIPGLNGTKVDIRLSLHPAVIAFMCVWLGFVGLAVVGATAAMLFGDSIPIPGLLIPIAMLIFGIALPNVGFWPEVKKQKPMLLEMFRRFDPESRFC